MFPPLTATIKQFSNFFKPTSLRLWLKFLGDFVQKILLESQLASGCPVQDKRYSSSTQGFTE